MLLSLVFSIMVVNLYFVHVLPVYDREKMYIPFFLLYFYIFFRQLDGEPLKIIQENLENELHIFYNLFVILYADDTVILSETKERLKEALNIFESYCEIWRPQVNVAKTKL